MRKKPPITKLCTVPALSILMTSLTPPPPVVSSASKQQNIGPRVEENRGSFLFPPPQKFKIFENNFP